MNILNLITYQREVCSSSFALLKTLSSGKEYFPVFDEVLALAKEIKINSKMKKVMEILKEVEGKTIIFTEYKATQIYIARFLEEQGYKVMLFNGSFSNSGKEYIKYLFQQQKIF